MTGNTFDVHLMNVTDKGIRVVDSNDYNSFYFISIEDFISTADKINFYELISLKSK